MLDPSLLLLLLYFSASVSQYPLPSPITVPKIEFADLNKNKTHVCGEEWAAETNLRTGIITLDAHWRNDEDGICTIAHELTHYLQFINKVSFRADIEPPAYKVTEACYRILYNHHDDSFTSWAHDQQIKHQNNKCTGE